MRAIYPGTFDPVTNGHLDVIERAATTFNSVVVAVAVNPAKHPTFTMEERVEMIRESCQHLDNVEVTCFTGLLVEFAAQVGAPVIVKGLRAVSDFEFEFQMAQMNRKLNPGVETVFLTWPATTVPQLQPGERSPGWVETCRVRARRRAAPPA